MEKYCAELFSEINPKRVYFVGIGGIGMSSLAKWFISQNWAVFGSDKVPSNLIDDLKKDGVRVKIGQKRANIPANIGLFVFNWAIMPENEEIKEAKRRNVPIMPYSKALGIVTRKYKTYAVTGAHGKSTTTSLLSLALTRGKKDPTVIVGTKLKEFGDSNFREGKSDMLVIEADDFHSSFLEHSPFGAIITNIDREHLDWYRNFDNVKKAFLKFLENIRADGIAVLNRDDKNLFGLKKQITVIAKKTGFSIVWYSLLDKDASKVRKAISHISGEHMVSNAYAAFLLAKYAGVKEKDILDAFKNYHGVWRRMEYKGEFKVDGSSVTVFDDYGHHPSEIMATLSGAKKFFKNKNIICVFQPHQGKRLKLLFSDFIKSFDLADALILLPIYKVAGRDEREGKYNSRLLAEGIMRRKKIKEVFYLEYCEDVPMWVSEIVSGGTLPHSDSVLIMMGAGDINGYTPLFFK